MHVRNKGDIFLYRPQLRRLPQLVLQRLETSLPGFYDTFLNSGVLLAHRRRTLPQGDKKSQLAQPRHNRMFDCFIPFSLTNSTANVV